MISQRWQAPQDKLLNKWFIWHSIQMQIATHPIEKWFQFNMQNIRFNHNVTSQIHKDLLYIGVQFLYSFAMPYTIELWKALKFLHINYKVVWSVLSLKLINLWQCFLCLSFSSIHRWNGYVITNIIFVKQFYYHWWWLEIILISNNLCAVLENGC